MLKFLKSIGLALVFWTSFSCVSNDKIIYLQYQDGNQPISEDDLFSYEITEHKLMYNDITEVKIQAVEDMIKNGFNSVSAQGNNKIAGAMEQNWGDIFT